ncbi:MAG: c-type cytochrome [Haliea sp.]|nr:c-type cytochrome [Haliea sp.]
MKKTIALIGPSTSCVTDLSTANADETAATAFQACAACHGDAAQGNAALGAPALAGQGAVYLQRQLQHFQNRRAWWRPPRFAGRTNESHGRAPD